MTLTFFLDESGGAGDAAKAGRDLGFGGQRVSVLAAIGTEDQARLAAGVAELSARHGLKSGEIKSTGVADLTGLAADLADMLWRDHLPMFVEVVDKRYLLVANLLNNILMPPVPGFDGKPGSQLFRAVVGDLVFHSIPDRILHAFVDICAEPSRQRVAALLAVLRRWAGRQDWDTVRQMLLDSLDDADAILADDPDDGAHMRLLPAPDPSVTGRQVWMLPALSSLTNVYARINKCRGGAVAGIRLVHDEDMLHGGILVEAKRLMEELAAAGAVPVVPHADYALREHAELSFADSASTPGIQAADVIAGFVMRFVRDFLAGTPITARRVDAMARIGRLSDIPQARGVNYVMSRQHLSEMDMPCA